MFGEPLELSKIDATQIIDYLYSFFHRDFVANKAYLANKIYINPRSHKKDDGKELDFWHLTTRENKQLVWENGKKTWKIQGRYTDFARASRIEWVKKIITNHNHEDVKVFYHQENNTKKNIRLYLWAFNHDFVVILQKLGKSSSFLVTSFYIDHEGKKNDYENRYNNYINGKLDKELCNWF
ncbi:hypothetical protein [Francisella salimarina]|uniref:RlfB protein n=1 Tax=Francisella salimarina TaxID=2599927 RepID=A0AAJ4TKA7_9GAMM|nr:hypothetical protein [Francisella salimarina]QWU98519.1 hypothetical protein KQR59_05235 [Francisella salimarina]